MRDLWLVRLLTQVAHTLDELFHRTGDSYKKIVNDTSGKVVGTVRHDLEADERSSEGVRHSMVKNAEGGGEHVLRTNRDEAPPEPGTAADRTHAAARGHLDQIGVTGAQLRALALTDNATRRLGDALREKGTKSDKAFKKSITVRDNMRNAILFGDWDAVGKIISKNNMSGEETDDLLNSLGAEVPLRRIIKKPTYDGDFLHSLPSSLRRTGSPPRSATYVIPELKTRVDIDMERNTVQFTVNPYSERPGWGRWEQSVTLPMQEQAFTWVSSSDIYGTRKEAFLSQLDVFGALAERGSTVYTHVTGELNLPGILTSESWGNTPFRGPSGLRGLNVERASLGNPEDYAAAIRTAASGDSIKGPIKNVRGAESFVSSHYVTPGESSPIVLFDESVTNLRHTIPNPGGIGIVGGTSFDDPSLIGIWVPPTFRENLLHWISQWPEDEITQVFRGKPHESILISSAEHLSERPRG
ncbi:hypothetical protein AB0C34_03485 [Nocardia sp. NPDC049220]|uniref:hypothetical protein n=1 Tax=Nocardia sp. NPDC049220 TaxID=3155273 RepID=UPI0033D14109